MLNARVRALDEVVIASVMSLTPCLVPPKVSSAFFALTDRLSSSWFELDSRDCAVPVKPANVVSMEEASFSCPAISPIFALNVVSSLVAFGLFSSLDKSLATLSATLAMVCAKVRFTWAATWSAPCPVIFGATALIFSFV